MAQNKIKYSMLVTLTIALAVAVCVSMLYDSGRLQKLELLSLDYRFLINSLTPRSSFGYSFSKGDNWIEHFVKQKTSRDSAGSKIVFIDMPEETVGTKTFMSSAACDDVIKILILHGAKTIALNTIMYEPQSGDDYTQLANLISESKGIYLPVLYDIKKEKLESLYNGDGVNYMVDSQAIFAAADTKTGHINAFPDADGKIRRVPAVISYAGDKTYHLGLQIAFDALGLGTGSVKFDPDRHVIILSRPGGEKGEISLEKDNQLIVNWAATGKDAIKHIPYRDIVDSYRFEQGGIRPIVDLKTLAGKICIIGATESNKTIGRPALVGYSYTPAGASGMIIASVLDMSFVRQAPKAFNKILIFLISIMVGLSIANRKMLSIMMIVILLSAVLVLLYMYGVSSAIYLIIAVGAAIPLGIFLSSFSLFSGLIFTVMGIISYLIVSAGIFKLFNLAVVTFYPVLAILLIYIFFYIYARLMWYFGNVRLFNQATQDGLTGLYNRRQLNLILDSEIANAALHKDKKMSIIMCDIDNFKKLNDTHGHQAGDAILKEFGKILKTKCRQSDMVARYGGEEFMIVLIGAGSSNAAVIAEGVRQAIEDKKFIFKGEQYGTTLSMGVVQLTGEKTKEELIEKADQALYKAKKAGKNRVSVFE